MMRDTRPAVIRQGARAMALAYGVVALVMVAGCSSSDEEAVTVETIVDRDQRDDAPPQTLAIDDDPAIDGQDPDEGEVASTPLLPATDTEPDADATTDDEATTNDDVTTADEAVDLTSTTVAPSSTTPVTETETDDDSGSSRAPRGPGVTVSANDLVGVADQTTVEPQTCAIDIPCTTLPATNGDSKGAVAMGEYQRNVFVPQGSVVDIYFDQSRSLDHMNLICDELGGHLATRSQDGSRWAGWRYCHDVDY